MPRYVAFLRGMNLGRRRIKNPELCVAFEEIGFNNVSAFQASGNVIFDTDENNPSIVSQSIEDGLRTSLEWEVPTFLRTAEEVQAIAAHSPFENVDVDARGKTQVIFMRRRIPDEERDTLMVLSTHEDMLETEGGEIYWSPKGNFLDSQLDHKILEGIVGSFTVRTKGTIERLAKRFLAEL